MCDHYQRLTRAAATARVPPVGAGAADSTQDIVLQSSFNGRAVGILFGIQRGLTAELFSSFEMAIVVDDGVPTVKRDFVEEQINITTQVFPSYELLGWYAVGNGPLTATDVAIHEAVAELNASPVFLHLQPDVAADAKQLPLTAYVREFIPGNRDGVVITATSTADAAADAVPSCTSGSLRPVFAPIPLRVESTESERLTADHCAASSVASSGGRGVDENSTVMRHLASTHSALGELRDRIDILHNYVLAVKNGTAPLDRTLLRLVATVAARVPIDDSEALQRALDAELTDSLLLSTTAAAAAGVYSLHELSAHLQTAAAVSGVQQLPLGHRRDDYRSIDAGMLAPDHLVKDGLRDLTRR